nr:MAG TPA: Terminase small subunit [Caudoviricetes sp.]
MDNISTRDKIKALEVMARMLGLDKPEEENGAGMLEELLKGLKQI